MKSKEPDFLRERGGYVSGQELFGQRELESRMTTRWAGHPLLFHESVDSTNLQAKRAAENGYGQGALVVTDMQTAGRGRRGRAWSSPPGANVYFTLILKPEYQPDEASLVTLVMALAVAKGIRVSCGVEPGIKWPNDIVADGKKVCGILTEMSAEKNHIHYVVVGAGINVGLQDFPPEIAPKAVSLEQVCGRKIARAPLVANVMKAFEDYYDIFERERSFAGLTEQYNSLLLNCGREVRILDPGGEYGGVSRGINERGELLVELADGGVTAVYAGEVSVRGIYGYV